MSKGEKEEKIFGTGVKEIERQLSMVTLSCDKNSPIKDNEFLEPCLRGAKKILENEKKKNMMRKIYRR